MGGETSLLRASFEARLASRISIHLLLDIVEFGRSDTPLLTKLLMVAIADANVGRFSRDPVLHARYALLENLPPDELRRPVSVNALAASLHQPFETVRRHIRQLEALGVCVATPSGVYVPTEVVASPPVAALLTFRYELIRRVQEELVAGGIAIAGPPLPPATDPRAPVRAVNRLYTDYFLRGIEILQRSVRDPVMGLVLLGVIRGGTEHLSHAEAAALMRHGVIPAERRAPVRVAELSRRLGVPYETVRRHVGWLVEEGMCERRPGGVRISAALTAKPETAAVLEENLANLQRLFRHIEAIVAELAAPQASRG